MDTNQWIICLVAICVVATIIGIILTSPIEVGFTYKIRVVIVAISIGILFTAGVALLVLLIGMN